MFIGGIKPKRDHGAMHQLPVSKHARSDELRSMRHFADAPHSDYQRPPAAGNAVGEMVAQIHRGATDSPGASVIKVGCAALGCELARPSSVGGRRVSTRCARLVAAARWTHNAGTRAPAGFLQLHAGRDTLLRVIVLFRGARDRDCLSRTFSVRLRPAFIS